MANDYSHIIKGQRVARRQSYAVQGNTVLRGKQTPAATRPSMTVYRQGVMRIVPLNQAIPQRPVAAPAPEAEPAKYVAVELDENIDLAPEPFLKRYLPRIALILCATAAAGFFGYNALLWQNSDYLVRPAADEALQRRMLEFAANGQTQPVFEATGMEETPAELTPSVPFAWQYYTVKKGDTVSKIAAIHALSMDAVIASNKMTNARNLREGDILRIPNMSGIPYTIAAGDTYERVAETFGVPLDAILDANDVQTGEMIAGEQIFIPGARLPADELRLALGEVFVYPVRGRISSPFGWRKDPFTGVRTFHKGIDIAADVGVPVKAALDGKISMVGFSPILGKYIIITHSNGYQTMYAHLNAVSVVRGERVRQGAAIGEVGNTGYSTGPHLHFVIYKNGREINPLEQLKL